MRGNFTGLRFLAGFVVTFAGLGYGQTSFQYQTTSDWGTGFNGQITISNTSSQPLSQWSLAFDFAPALTIIWDASIASHSGNHYVIQPADWDATIPAGGSVSFGFGGAPGNIQQGPANFQLTGATPAVSASGGVQIAIAESSQWTGGFTAGLTISNPGPQAISPWSLSFAFAPSIQSLWNGAFTFQDGTYQISGSGSTASIPAGGSISLGFTAAGTLTASAASGCMFNGSPCSIQSSAVLPPPAAVPPAIVIATVDGAAPATQFTIAQGSAGYSLSAAGVSNPQFSVLTNNPAVVSASIAGQTLQLTGLQPGRAGLEISEQSSGAIRYIGVRVLNADGSLPGLPDYVSLGSVSDDTPENLSFWQAFASGNLSHRVDSRYIYLNGGPFQGWTTWTANPGDRVTSYVSNSRMLGMIPIFVFYNIPDSSEGYQLDLSHAQDPAYMSAYFTNLQLALNLIAQQSPDDPVEMILEPDFLGYLAQNAGAPASAIPAATSAAYDSGVLGPNDPQFPNTVAGLVQSINYTISKLAPTVRFGWQINLWASPAGGWTTPVPVTGLMHVTDTGNYAAGQAAISAEATAIANYYLAAGVATQGAAFVSIDKYGLDAAGFESSAAQNPAASTWFWNNDLWQNYLAFVSAVHQTTRLPVVLWQLPVGHINSTQEPDPYLSAGLFPDLTDTFQNYEDSAPTFFFGDTFVTSGARFSYFSTNQSGDPALAINGQAITWGSHMSGAANAGVISVLFGAGVGASTTNIGVPPTDGFWWITKAQDYLAQPVPLAAPAQ